MLTNAKRMPSKVTICGIWIDNHWLSLGSAWAQQAHTMLCWLMLTHLGHMIFLSLSHLAAYLVFTKIWTKHSIRVVVGLELWLEKSFNFSTTCGWKDKKIIESVGHTKVHLALIYLSIRTVGKVWNKLNRVRCLGFDHDLASNTFGAGQRVAGRGQQGIEVMGHSPALAVSFGLVDDGGWWRAIGMLVGAVIFLS